MLRAAWMLLLGVAACAAPGAVAWPAPETAIPHADPRGAENLDGATSTPVEYFGELDHMQFRAAQRAYEALLAAPTDEERIVWYGRRLAYLGAFELAVEVYTQGLALHPDSARLLRHRGHRWITLREFERAEQDLARAASLIAGTADEVEPDGKPNAAGIPISTLHTNIWYHQGLAQYLRGDYAAAASSFERCLEAARNRDMEVAARYWLYLSRQRSGQPAEADAALAPVRADWQLLENHAYHRLLLLFRQEAGFHASTDGTHTEEATYSYGVACFLRIRTASLEPSLATSLAASATSLLRHTAQTGPWPAFATIAAEADLHRAWVAPR